MNMFISCDWGTTSFRLRLLDAHTYNVLAETNTPQGIAATYDLWKEQQNLNRLMFYSNCINTYIKLFEVSSGINLKNVPVIISGMASSSIGMKELAYKKIPFEIKTENLLVDFIKATPSFQHNIILVSGVCSATDVMRGEETILAGCAVNNTYKRHLIILPGTHSKHIIIENGIIVDIKTYMTGELFQLLSTKSVLSNSVEKGDVLNPANAFITGIKEAATSSLLNNIFHVRTNTLFNKKNKQYNYNYLSGLLIGEELQYLLTEDVDAVTILSSGSLSELYHTALTAINIKRPVLIEDADEALINAQTILYKQYK